MAKYICECLDGARKCTHETPGFSAPTLCCVRAHATCHWHKFENQEVETPAPKLPDWCKVGAWVWHGPVDGIAFEQPYFKIERTVGELAYGKSHNNGFPVHYTYLKPARLRPWNDDEMKSKVGKVFEMENGDLTFCLGYRMDRGAIYFAGKGPFAYSAKILVESDWELDGLPCGVLEHKNDQGEWVK